jgi:hypothetical protein
LVNAADLGGTAEASTLMASKSRGEDPRKQERLNRKAEKLERKLRRRMQRKENDDSSDVYDPQRAKQSPLGRPDQLDERV